MLCGELSQGCLGLTGTRLEMMQVQSVTWIPAAQPRIRLGWGRGKELALRVLHGPPNRSKKKGARWASCSGQVLYVVLLLLW